MSGLALVTITLGAVIIVSRGVLVLFPKRTLEFTRRMIDKPAVIRLVGLLLALLGLAMIVTGSGDDRSAAQFVRATGWVLLVVTLPLMVVLPSVYRGITAAFVDVMEGGAGTRALGAIGVAVGVVFVWVGVLAL